MWMQDSNKGSPPKKKKKGYYKYKNIYRLKVKKKDIICKYKLKES